jgi:hypothetical protein
MFSNTVAIRTSYTFEEVMGLNLNRCILEASTKNYFVFGQVESFTDAHLMII